MERFSSGEENYDEKCYINNCGARVEPRSVYVCAKIKKEN